MLGGKRTELQDTYSKSLRHFENATQNGFSPNGANLKPNCFVR